MIAFTADDELKQELDQIVMCQYFNDFKIYVVNRGRPFSQN